uniref:Uncharacterized protein n=1 Tax=Romanomermis culicivorax TaxID=13658 RepID=A0A915JYM2_ROMCU
MAAMVVSIGCGLRLLLIVVAVAIFSVIAFIVITMGVERIVMAIETNGARMAIATVVSGIVAAGRQSVGLRP